MKKKRIFSIINDYKLNEIAKHFKDEKMIEKEENDQVLVGDLFFVLFWCTLRDFFVISDQGRIND